MTGLRGVRALRSRPWIKSGGARFSSGVISTVPWVKGRVLVCAGLGVNPEELMVLSGYGYSSTLKLSTQVLGKLYLPLNCSFAYKPNR